MQPQSTSDYIASHGVREALEAAVKLVLDEKPADPLAVIAATLVAQRQLGTSRLSSRSGAESAHAQTSAEVTSVCSNQHEAAKTVTTRRALLRSKFLRRHASAEDLFAAWDMDHNGRLSIEELTEGLVDNGYSEMEASQILTLLDVDHDGTVSEAEFREGFYRSLPAQTRMARLPSTVDFASLDGGTYPSLPVEEAGITLHQLRILWAHIELSCVRDGWMSVRGARITQPELVNLYDAVRYVIKPATNARQCSLVELMATRAQPPKWFVSHWWGHPVLRTLHCLEQASAAQCPPLSAECPPKDDCWPRLRRRLPLHRSDPFRFIPVNSGSFWFLPIPSGSTPPTTATTTTHRIGFAHAPSTSTPSKESRWRVR